MLATQPPQKISAYLRHKQKIGIPLQWGRSMLGVIDETGTLQSGEVFVQYTKKLYRKHDAVSSDRRTMRGRVLVTKNPMLFTNDMRLFNAVSKPGLAHHCDVIVFSHLDVDRLNGGVMGECWPLQGCAGRLWRDL